MIFPVIKLENIVQENDRTRIDGTRSYITSDEAAITLVEIEPEAAAGFVDVTSSSYLDFQYAADGDKVVSIRITTDGAPVTKTATLPIITTANDKLFSSDDELMPYEPGLLNWVKDGRNSFLDIHRAAQDRILTQLDEKRIWKSDGSRLTKDDIIDTEEVNDWSKFMVLRIIFEGLSNATDDIFHEKALRYKEMELQASSRAALRFDTNGDGIEEGPFDVMTTRLLRR